MGTEFVGSIRFAAVVGREVDVEEFSRVNVDNRDEVQRVGIKVIVLGEPCEHQALLDSSALREPFVVSNGPSIAVNLVRFYSDIFAEGLNRRIVTND